MFGDEKKRTPKDLRWDLKPQFKVPQNVKRKSINKKKNLQELTDMKERKKNLDRVFQKESKSRIKLKQYLKSKTKQSERERLEYLKSVDLWGSVVKMGEICVGVREGGKRKTEIYS